MGALLQGTFGLLTSSSSAHFWSQAAWLLLSEVALHRPDTVEWTFLNAQWERSFDSAEGVDATLLLKAVAAAASR
jgi:hypothetical protein